MPITGIMDIQLEVPVRARPGHAAVVAEDLRANIMERLAHDRFTLPA